MNLLIISSTGVSGRQLVSQALEGARSIMLLHLNLIPPLDTMVANLHPPKQSLILDPTPRGPMIPFSLDHAKEILKRTPGVLDPLLKGLPADWVIRTDDGKGWSPFDVVGHLIHGEKTDWIPRARIILEQGTTRTFDPFDRNAMHAASEGKSLNELLNEFRSLRTENLRILDTLGLTSEQLRLKGTHPDFGEVTLQQLIAAWVVHDLGHLTQIARSMARHYAGEVGPWRAFMGVLKEV